MSQSELEKWNNKRKRKNDFKFAIGFLLLALFVLVDGIREGFANMSEERQFFFLIGFGMLMIWLSIDQGFLQRNRCTTIIKAECIDIRYTRVGYHPKFRYRWEGQTYVGDVLRYASKRKTKQRYAVGNEYEILINPDKPREIRVDFKIGLSNIFMIIIGIAMVALPIYKIFFEK